MSINATAPILATIDAKVDAKVKARKASKAVPTVTFNVPELVVKQADKPLEVIRTPAPGRIVQVDPVRIYIASVRKDRVMTVASASETVIDAIDAVSAVSRAIRAGEPDAHTVGREEAALVLRGACATALSMGAPPAKVCALKWANLARLASAKRK